MDEPLTVTAQDGACLAYEVLGSQWVGLRVPIVFIGGMSSLRGDWSRLSSEIAHKRPVLIFDHRGMGDSKYANSDRNDEITIETLARDLLCILTSLRWPRLALCGFSMGGVVLQQLLFLPYHPTDPVSLPFHATHVFLTGTLCSVLRDRRYGLRIDTSTPKRPLTTEEKIERSKPMVDASFDPTWLADPDNKDRYDWWLRRMITGRPLRTILKQAHALSHFDFSTNHEKIPRDIRILVIHGEKDAIVPFSSGQEILSRIPWAQSLQVGDRPGQVPNLAFGHHWFEYFPVQVWVDAIEQFLGDHSSPFRL